MLNQTVIMGRLTRDPELRRTGSGIAVTSFTVAVDRDYSSKEGGEKETDFIDCVAWRQTGEFVSKYFTKGRMIAVVGRIQSRNWTDKDGNKRRTVEVNADSVYFADSKKAENSGARGNYNSPQGGHGAPQGGYNAPAGGYSAPAGSYAPPAGGYAAPAGGYDAPAYGGYATGADYGADPMMDMDESKLPY